MPTRPHTHRPRTAHPQATILRQRAAHLRELADRIERSRVMVLDDAPGALARHLLERNVHQLHRAADGLREAAFRLRRRADDLDLATAVAS